jgi:predicted nuclease of predicted toxin-antitoxin system
LSRVPGVSSKKIMVSKRKEKIRSDARFEDGWFEVSEDLWQEPGKKPERLRLLADANFPRGLVERIRKPGIEVKTAQELRIHRLPDEQILQEAANRGFYLITLDRDFWSDERFPLRSSGRLVFVDARDEHIAETNGFKLLLVLLKSWGGGHGHGKIRATTESVYLKFLNDRGKQAAYEFKAIRPYIYAREHRGFGS